MTKTTTATVDDNHNNKPATKKKIAVKIFILLGQSNMVGMGKVSGESTDGTLEYAVKTKKLYPYLVEDDEDNDGNFRWKKVINDRVRNVFTMGSGLNEGTIQKNDWLTVEHCKTIGPEIGIGYMLGRWLDNNNNDDNEDEDRYTLVLKSCIGNRSLGWDLLPPGSPPFECNDDKDETKRWHYAGYKESPSRWEVGTHPAPPAPGSWYAGMQYDGDIGRIKRDVLSDLSKFIPSNDNDDDSTTENITYEVSGFFWWQGDKDRYDIHYADRYEMNLIRLIKQLRIEFESPDAKFVLATLGQTSKKEKEGKRNATSDSTADRRIFDAQMNVQTLPELIGNVSCVYSKPFCHGGGSNSHYNHNAETYMDVGLEMGRVMTNLLG